MQKKYLITFLLFITGFFAASILISIFFAPLRISSHTALTFILFVITTLSMHYFLTEKEGERPAAFIQKFLLATTLKLLLYLAIIVVFFLFKKSEAKVFIVWFLWHYVCFTIFETLMLYCNPKK